MEIVRDYRLNLKGYNVTYKETDLLIFTDKVLKKEAFYSIIQCRNVLENYITLFPEFFTSLKPVKILESDPEIILNMKKAAIEANVGPFASVAGAIAENVAKDLNRFSDEVIVENGGDTFLMGKKDKIVKVLSTHNFNIGLKIEKNFLPISVCSSSAKIGHSYSKGKAELVTVLSHSAPIADAFATAICNKIKKESDIEKIIKSYENNKNISGCLIFFNNKIAGWGNIKIIKIEE